MRSKGLKWTSAMTALLLAAAMMPSAVAQCGISTKLVKPSNWNPQMGGVYLVRAGFGNPSDNNAAPSIVGMWHVVLTAQTFNDGPADFVADNALSIWHSDGTEIMNSNRPAQDGDFCLGVWVRTGKLTYYLNHIPWAGNDTTNAPSGIGNPTAGTQLTENVTLSPDGNSYSGTFTLKAYDQNDNLAVTITGTLAATRVTTSTSITSLF